MNGPRARTRVRERIDRGEPAVVVAGHTVSADTADFLGRFGFDGYWLEGEHGATTWDRIADISRACELWGMTAMMRIHRLDASLVGRALTLGAGGIVVPQVQTAEEAARARRAPAGSPRLADVACRWAGAPTAAPNSSPTKPRRPCSSCNSKTPSPSTTSTRSSPWTGIDVVFIAPNDLAQSMGHQGEPGHPEVQDAIADGLQRIAAAGRVAGTLCPPNRIEHFVEHGAGFLYASFDAWIADGASRFLSTVDTAAHRSTLE